MAENPYPRKLRDTIDKVNCYNSEEGADGLREYVPQGPSATPESASPKAIPSSIPGIDNSEPKSPAPSYPKPGPA